MCVCPEPGLALCEGKSGAERRIKGKKTEQRRLRGVSVEAPGGRRGVRGREGGKEGVAWHRARRVGGAATALRPSPGKPAPGSGQRGSIPAGWAPAPEPGRPGGPLSAAHAGAVRGRSVGRAGRKRGGEGDASCERTAGACRSDGGGGRRAVRRLPRARPLQRPRPARPALPRPPPRVLPGHSRRPQRPHLQREYASVSPPPPPLRLAAGPLAGLGEAGAARGEPSGRGAGPGRRASFLASNPPHRPAPPSREAGACEEGPGSGPRRQAGLLAGGWLGAGEAAG